MADATANDTLAQQQVGAPEQAPNAPPPPAPVFPPAPPSRVAPPFPRALVRRAVRNAFAQARAWSAIWVVELALALAPATMFFAWIDGVLANRYPPGGVFRELGTVFRFDQREELGALDASIGHAGAVLAVLSMLLGAFAAGGWVTRFLAADGRRDLAGFLAGGARFFGRFARLILVTLALLALATWIAFGKPWDALVLRGLLHVPEHDLARLETLKSEPIALLVRGAQAALHALLFGLVLVLGDYTRVRIALYERRSVVWAAIESAATIALHPVRTLRPILGVFALEVLVVVALGSAAHAIDAGIERPLEVAVLFALGQLALAWRIVLRGARYHAAVDVTRALSLPDARPDPWRRATAEARAS